MADTTASIPYPYERAMADEFIAARSGPEEERIAVWAIVRDTDAAFLGVASLAFLPELESAEIGYWLGVPYWRHGYTTEAVRALVDHGFGTLGLVRINGSHLARNPASGRVMEKLGMHKDGVLRWSFRKWGILEDIAWWSILRDEWEAGRR